MPGAQNPKRRIRDRGADRLLSAGWLHLGCVVLIHFQCIRASAAQLIGRIWRPRPALIGLTGRLNGLFLDRKRIAQSAIQKSPHGLG